MDNVETETKTPRSGAQILEAFARELELEAGKLEGAPLEGDDPTTITTRVVRGAAAAQLRGRAARMRAAAAEAELAATERARVAYHSGRDRAQLKASPPDSVERTARTAMDLARFHALAVEVMVTALLRNPGVDPHSVALEESTRPAVIGEGVVQTFRVRRLTPEELDARSRVAKAEAAGVDVERLLHLEDLAEEVVRGVAPVEALRGGLADGGPSLVVTK